MRLRRIIVFVMCTILLTANVGCGAKQAVRKSENSTTNNNTVISVSDGMLKIDRPEREEETDMGKKGWTILVYMCGTDLESEGACATSDLFEMQSATYNKDVNVVVQTGGAQEWHCDVSDRKITRLRMGDGQVEVVEEIKGANMGKSQTLSEFIEWGVENYPAANMGLVFWNHGGGSISGVCFDELYGNDSLSLREIEEALSDTYELMTERFEFIGFDACLMSTLETANILVPYAKYMYASAELEPGGGWDYEAMMEYLAKNPTANGKSLGKVMAESYYEVCEEESFEEYATMAITDLSKVDKLLVCFDKVAKELYTNSKLGSVARAIQKSDNYGGNARGEGYTNMVDLKSMLNNVKEYAPSANSAIEALDDAVVGKINGYRHRGAGGLSVYFPLSVQGTMELKIFSEICTSKYYMSFVEKIANTASGIEMDEDYAVVEDSDNIWDEEYNFGDLGTNIGEFADISSDSTIQVDKVYFDENGTYTVELSDMDNLNVPTCSIFLLGEDGETLYLGEDDDVVIDYDYCTLTDNFEGTWFTIDGVFFPIEVIYVDDELSVYTCCVLYNGKETNLRVEYDWVGEEWHIVGIWSGIDYETGMAGRDIIPLKKGDVIAPLYYVVSDDEDGYVEGEDVVYSSETEIYYDDLPEADYIYSMSLYDVYGNVYYTEGVTFIIDENGDIWYDEDELKK